MNDEFLDDLLVSGMQEEFFPASFNSYKLLCDDLVLLNYFF